MFEAANIVPVAGSTQAALWCFAEQAITIVGMRREGARRPPEALKGQRGAYVLLGPVDAAGGFDAYAGTAWAQRLGARMPNQLHSSQWATRAFSIHRDTPGGLGEQHARFLERALYDALVSTPHCRVKNGVAPTSGPVSTVEQRWLTACLDPFLSVLELTGYRIGPNAGTVANAPVSIADLIRAGLLSPGEKLVPAWRPAGIPPATITAAGGIRWRGTEYPGARPSVPARLARGGRKTNGWDYWRLDRPGESVPLARLRKAYRAALAA